MDTQTRKEILAIGNVCRQSIPAPEKRINLFIGNNIMGACVDALGSMEEFPNATGVGITHVNHRRHYCKATHGMEFKVPLVRTHLDVRMQNQSLLKNELTITNYSQELNISCGTVYTSYIVQSSEKKTAQISLAQYFSFEDKTDFHCDIKVTAAETDVEILFDTEAITDYQTHYNFMYRGFCEHIEVEQQPALKVSTGVTWTIVVVPQMEDSEYERKENHLYTRYFCPAGEEKVLHAGFVAANENYAITPEAATLRWVNTPEDIQRKRHETRWQIFWNQSMLDIRGAKRLQAIWLRSFYYMAISEPDHPDNIGTPGGLAGSKCWPFAFPQDYSFVFQNFLAANHLEIANGTATYWKEHLAAIVAYTKRLLQVDGAFMPWCLPNTSFEGFNAYSVPNRFYYELHNSGYVAHICYTYYRYTKDETYLREVAIPVLSQIARFYQNISSFDSASGHYEVLFKPITGQHEQGASNQKNYLCCMISAQYSMEKVLELYQLAGLKPEPAWVDIAQKRYAFDKVTVDGKLLTYEGAPEDEKIGAPMRLSTLALLPIEWMNEGELLQRAYRERYSWIIRAELNQWGGWSLGEVLMASMRMRSDQGAKQDLDNLLATAQMEKPYLDWDDIQFFESSGAKERCYFITSHGLVSAALSEMALQTYGNSCVLFPILLPELEKAGYGFDHFLTPFGFSISARWQNGAIEAELVVSKGEKVKIELCHTQKPHALYRKDGSMVCQSEDGVLCTDGLETGEIYFIRSI